MYKISISLEILSKQQRDDFMRELRSLMLRQPAAIRGKVKQTIEAEVMGNDLMPLFPFGVESFDLRPLETAIEETETTSDEATEAESTGDEAAIAVADDEATDESAAVEAEPATDEDDEPRTPFDDLLGRERSGDE